MGENFGERLPEQGTPEDPPKIERFEQFDLEVGDDVYRNTGTRYRITGIVPNKESPGGGNLEIERLTINGELNNSVINFQSLINTQDQITNIDRARMPENAVLTGRIKVVLPKLNSIIENEKSSPQEVRDAKLKRAQIYRELRPRVSDTDDTIAD